MTETKKWQSEAGPRQTKQVVEALRKLDFQKNGMKEVHGVQDGSTAEEAYNRSNLQGITYNIFGVGGPSNPKAVELYQGVAEKYGWLITRSNYKAILADLTAAIKLAMDAIPYKDSRRTPEKDAEIKQSMDDRNARETAARDQAEAAWAGILAKKPAGAAALIIAEYNEDRSDPMSDYHANQTMRVVAIGWRFGSREDFKQLQAAAVRFKEIGKELEEHRENYSMGHGNYLSDHGWDGAGTGWVVKSASLTGRHYGPAPEDALPDAPAPTAETREVEVATSECRFGAVESTVKIRPSSTGRQGYVEIVFDSKPDVAIRAELKSAGFRWAKSNGCWYGPESRLPERYKVTA